MCGRIRGDEMMSAAANQDLKKVLREHELKATSQRIALLKLLNSTQEHFDAEEIYFEKIVSVTNYAKTHPTF